MSNSLPFNSAMIRGLFTPLPPEHEPDHAPGFWTVLQGYSLLLPVGSQQEQLPEGPLPAGIVPEAGPLKIGLWQGKPLRALRIAPGGMLPPEYEALPFQGPDARLDNTLATIAGRAAQMLHWGAAQLLLFALWR